MNPPAFLCSVAPRRLGGRSGRAARRILLALVAPLFAAALLAPVPAAAHAQFVRSSPPAGAVVPSAPGVIQLWFSEALEPKGSDVTVFDRTRQRVDSGSSVDPGDPTSMIVRLGSLSPGTYTVAWRTLSAVDGHPAAGSFTLSFGTPDQVGTTALADTAQEQASLNTLAVLARWLSYLGLALALGGLLFRELVWQPALAEAQPDGAGGADALDVAVCQTLNRVFWAGLGLGLLGIALLAVARGMSLEPADPLSGAARIVTSTRFGQILLVRSFLFVLVGVLVALREPGIAFGLGGAGLLTFPLAGHAAASSYLPFIGITADWAHLIATVIWAGGLPALAVTTFQVLRRTDLAVRSRLVGPMARRFSAIGLVSLPVLISTGLWASWSEVGAVEALTQNLYGQTLIVKVALVALVGTIAALNLLFFVPRLRRASLQASGRKHTRAAAAGVRAVGPWFARTVAAEAVAGALILLGAGVLTESAPPIDDPTVVYGEAMQQDAPVGDLNVRLTLRPNRAGDNEMALDVRNLARRPVTDLAGARVNLTMLDHDMGTTEIPLQPAGDGRYVTRTPAVSMFGNWRADVILTESSGDDVTGSFRFKVPDGPPARVVRPVLVFPGLTTGVIVGIEAIVGTLLLLGAARYLRRKDPRVARWLVVPAAAVFLLGGAMLMRESLVTPVSAAESINPFPNDPASVLRGKTIYEQNCAICHGAGGHGDGPLAASIRPRPADLQQHVDQHSEAQLYAFISKGVGGTAMPAWETQLSADERWDVLNFIRSAFNPGNKS